MNEINFGMDGLSLDNTTWYNAKTGDSFKVRSNYFEDNDMKLQTYDGRVISLSRMNDYVQWNSKDPVPTKPIVTPKPKQIDEVPDAIRDMVTKEGENNGLLPEDLELIQRIGREQKQPQYKDSPALRPAPKTNNFDIIDRALKKTKTPDWSVVMKWSKFPEQELTLLKTVMDIPVEEVADYYMQGIQTEFDAFMNNIRKQICNYICDKLGVEIEKASEKPTKTKSKK